MLDGEKHIYYLYNWHLHPFVDDALVIIMHNVCIQVLAFSFWGPALQEWEVSWFKKHPICISVSASICEFSLIDKSTVWAINLSVSVKLELYEVGGYIAFV